MLRYHGGKWRLATWVMTFFPPHRVYVEPYGGAASVLIQKPRVYAEIYNDLDGEIVNVFRVLQDPAGAARLEQLLRVTPFARKEFEGVAYTPSSDPVESARRTIMKSFMGFGSSAIHGRSRGMRTRASVWGTGSGECMTGFRTRISTHPDPRTTGFRSNSNRSGTTPAHDWANWPDAIVGFVERLAGVVIECQDGLKVMATHDRPDSLHYVDPPYVRATRSKARKRKAEYRFEMTDDEHRLLATCLHGLQGCVVLSGYQSDLYAELYAGWERHDRQTLADGARKRLESVWLSPRTSAALHEVKLAL